jgi:hypothetical protein
MRNGVGFMKAKLAVAFWVSTALMALPAKAQTTNTVNASVNATAGIERLFELDCHGVDFGSWYVPLRRTGGQTFITLSVDVNDQTGATTGTVSGNTNLVSLESRYPPKAGTCYITGSESVPLSLKTSISQNLALTMGGLNLYGKPSPSVPAVMLCDLALVDNARVPVTAGRGSFRVVGTLTIPETIVIGNHGGYQTQNHAYINVSDAL